MAMQVYPNKLADTLQAKLASVYCIFGDEPFQKYRSLDLIRKHAKAKGFDDRLSLVADKDFDWQQLTESTQSMSLFSSLQLIELELPTAKPGKEGSKCLIDTLQALSQDTLLIIHGPRIGKDVQNTKWFKVANQAGPYIPCFALEGRALSDWLRGLANEKGCNIDNQALALLSEFSEGNMLAGAQEIEKLVLNFGDQSISLADVERVVVNQARYTVFQLVDAFLAGNSKHTTKLLQALESEGLEPAIVLWALSKEWQTLVELKSTQGQINWNRFRIWGAKQKHYQAAMQRLSFSDLHCIGKALTQADSLFKNQVVTRPYIALCHLCLLFVFPKLKHTAWSV